MEKKQDLIPDESDYIKDDIFEDPSTHQENFKNELKFKRDSKGQKFEEEYLTLREYLAGLRRDFRVKQLVIGQISKIATRWRLMLKTSKIQKFNVCSYCTNQLICVYFEYFSFNRARFLF